MISGSKAVSGAAGHFYLSGMEEGVEYLFCFSYVGGQPSAKYVMFDGSGIPPAANPDVFVIGGVEYLLFAWGNGNFALYARDSEDAERVYFVASTMFDFSAIRTMVQSYVYKSPAWNLCPEYNDVRKTLYFTLAFWIEDAAKGDYIEVRIWQSVQTGNVFDTPTRAQGGIDPYNAVHFADESPLHTPDDFTGRMGLWWIGRLYMTDDGTKAYFNVLNIMTDPDGIMKPGDPYIAPTPNSQDFGGFIIDDVYHPSLIRNYICEADVDAGGSFNNVTQLSPAVNSQGINFISDITGDGSTIYVSHMDVDEDFWPYLGWGPDGLALELCQKSAVTLEQWIGYIIIYTRSGAVWTKSGSIGEEAADDHTPKYLENRARYDAYIADPVAFEAALKAASPWIPTTTTMAPTFEHGIFEYNLCDDTDIGPLPDDDVLGDWVVCDFVREIGTFDPADQYWGGSFWWTATRFIADYSSQNGYDGGALGFVAPNTWTEGFVIWNRGSDSATAMEYIIQDNADGNKYLFIQWKSGDYTLRASKPYYYVFQRP